MSFLPTQINLGLSVVSHRRRMPGPCIGHSPIAEYNAVVPGAISTFSPYTPEALATAIGKLLAVPRAELTRGLAELSQQLSISVIYDRRVQAYQRALELL